jgi:integrase
LPTAQMTMTAYLKWWLSECLGDREPSTRDNYKRTIEKHVSPHIGGVLLDCFNPSIVQSWVARLEKDEVGSRTRQNAFIILSAAVAHAEKLMMIPYNPCKRVSKPKHDAKVIQPFTLEQAAKLMKKTEGTKWHALIVLAMTTGMRIGELLGLEWTKIDWAASTLRIDQQASDVAGLVVLKKPKTKSSIRTVDLTPKAVSALKLHKAILLKEGNAGSALVFPSTDGKPRGHGNVRQRWWNPLLIELAIEARGIHHTRHTYATHSLLGGVHPLVVSKALGHSKPSVTLDIYGHVMREAESKAVEIVSKLFG